MPAPDLVGDAVLLEGALKFCAIITQNFLGATVLGTELHEGCRAVGLLLDGYHEGVATVAVDEYARPFTSVEGLLGRVGPDRVLNEVT